MPFEKYKTLGVEPTAAPEEIKRAYYRLVRQHPPEKDPETFKTIRAAYDTLSDPKARQAYDALETHGDEVGRLLERVLPAVVLGRLVAHIVPGGLEELDDLLAVLLTLLPCPGVVNQRHSHATCSTFCICTSSSRTTMASIARG